MADGIPQAILGYDTTQIEDSRSESDTVRTAFHVGRST
jgi:hypothetical protein